LYWLNAYSDIFTVTTYHQSNLSGSAMWNVSFPFELLAQHENIPRVCFHARCFRSCESCTAMTSCQFKIGGPQACRTIKSFNKHALHKHILTRNKGGVSLSCISKLGGIYVLLFLEGVNGCKLAHPSASAHTNRFRSDMPLNGIARSCVNCPPWNQTSACGVSGCGARLRYPACRI
jgi:hypothetical protein